MEDIAFLNKKYQNSFLTKEIEEIYDDIWRGLGEKAQIEDFLNLLTFRKCIEFLEKKQQDKLRKEKV